MDGTIRLRSAFFNESKLVMNKHRLSQAQGVSYPTLMKYISRGNGDYDIRTFSGDVLFAIFTGTRFLVQRIA
jgi:hypothetical protein